MSNWPLIAAIPPLLVWLALYVYLAKIDARLRAVEQKQRTP